MLCYSCYAMAVATVAAYRVFLFFGGDERSGDKLRRNNDGY